MEEHVFDMILHTNSVIVFFLGSYDQAPVIPVQKLDSCQCCIAKSGEGLACLLHQPSWHCPPERKELCTGGLYVKAFEIRPSNNHRKKVFRATAVLELHFAGNL